MSWLHRSRFQASRVQASRSPESKCPGVQSPKKIIIRWNISLVIALWADKLIAYTALNPISTFLPQFYPGDLASFEGSTIIVFFIATLIIRWFNQSVALPRWYFFIDNRTWGHLLSSSSPQLFLPYFAVTKIWVLRSLKHLHFLGKSLWGVCSKFLRDSMGKGYYKKDYTKGEVNVVNIIQIRLQKMKRMYLWQVFMVWLVKFGKKIVF